MDIQITDFTIAIFVLYLLISSNFQAQLFPCRVQTLFNSSQTVKHFLGFLTMTFFVILVNSKNKLPITNLFALSAGAYVWFMVTTKMNVTAWFLMMGFLSVIFILQVYKDHQEENIKEAKTETITKIQTILSYSIIAVTLLGVLLYMGEKRIEYGEKFNLGTFLLGAPTCRGISPTPTTRNALRAALGR